MEPGETLIGMFQRRAAARVPDKRDSRSGGWDSRQTTGNDDPRLAHSRARLGPFGTNSCLRSLYDKKEEKKSI